MSIASKRPFCAMAISVGVVGNLEPYDGASARRKR